MLKLFPNIKIVVGTAEAATLPDSIIDAITCAQALGWFDLRAFGQSAAGLESSALSWFPYIMICLAITAFQIAIDFPASRLPMCLKILL